MNEQEVKYIRDLVNAYSRTIDHERFRDYGNDIEITENTALQIDECRGDTQFDSRDVVKYEEPYTGTPLKALTVTALSQVDRWIFEVGPLAKGQFQDAEGHRTVPGSEHAEVCHTCKGAGKLNCPTCTGKGSKTGWHVCPSCEGRGVRECSMCGGSGAKRCSACNGSGSRRVKKTRKKQVARQYYSTGQTVTRYEYVDETYWDNENCPACGGRGEIRGGCPKCGGSGSLTCIKCRGNKEVPCETCSRTGKVVCGPCQGRTKLLHSIRITQKLEHQSDGQVFAADEWWAEVDKLPWREECPAETVFEVLDDQLGSDLYPEQSDYNASFDKILDTHISLASDNCHIRFQRAAVIRYHFSRVRYNYNGKSYTGYITGNTFHPVTSPIIEYADELIKGAESSLKRSSAVDARRKLKEAQSLNVEGNKRLIRDMLEQVNNHINDIAQLGHNIVFWFVALFATPYVLQFYDGVNPVLPYASFVNRPDWFAYDYLPVAQVLVFLYFFIMMKGYLLETDYSKLDLNHTYLYFALGIVKTLVGAVLLFVLLAAVNYLGLVILSAIGMWVLWWIIKVVFFIVIMLIILISKLF